MDPAQRIADVISAPLEALLTSLGAGIGAAQAELDRHSIEIQQRIDEDPVLAQYGLQATWYRIPTTELELKVAVAIEEQSTDTPTAPASPLLPHGGIVAGRDIGRLPRLWVQPVNARYANQFNYDVNASSTVRLSVAAVPPPGEAAAGAPTQTEEAIRAIADPHLKTDNNAFVGRVTVNYNAGARAWYVIQTQEADGVVTLVALVKVDDLSGAIIKQVGGD
jgi:hypothetical protein